jgi:aryl-alcohol dehydrogenase-like predicted oxidoreductase
MSDVELRRLGDSGLTVSAVGLGCNNFGRRVDLDGTKAVVAAALDAGVTLFDTADIYGESEDYLGKALRGHRDEVVLATKFGMDMRGANGPDWGARGSRRYIRSAVESSLRRLKTEWIDLYQLHAPDPLTPIEETLASLSELVREGKVRYIGCSNFAAWEIADADWTARRHGYERFISAQNRYNLLERDIEAEVVPACERFGVGVLPFFPLANGLLTGKYRRGAPPPPNSRLASRPDGIDEDALEVVEQIEAFAAERGVSVLDVAIGGLAAQPAVASVIAGATTPEQVTANVAAGTWQPTIDDLDALDEIIVPPAH